MEHGTEYVCIFSEYFITHENPFKHPNRKEAYSTKSAYITFLGVSLFEWQKEEKKEAMFSRHYFNYLDGWILTLDKRESKMRTKK